MQFSNIIKSIDTSAYILFFYNQVHNLYLP